MEKPLGVEEAGKRTDEELVEAAKGGDDAAFRMLVVRHKRQVIRLASRFFTDPYELDDVCQEVFIKAYEHLGSYRRVAPFGHWLARITVNACYDAMKKARPRKGHLSLEDLSMEIGDPRPGEEYAARRAYEMLTAALARMKPDERLIVTLLGLEEKTIEDISGLTGWSAGNIRVRAHRARQALKKILEAHHES